LIDVDSKILNLALMKISSWHKVKGDTLVLTRGANVGLSGSQIRFMPLFKKNKNALDSLVLQRSDIDNDIGGSGYDLKRELPPEIENMKPDYNP
jgi:hypothetical protein